MNGTIQWLGVGTAAELCSLLPGVLEEEGCHTLVYNANRWRSDRHVAGAVRATFGLVADNDGTVVAGSQWMDLRALMHDGHREDDEADAAAYFRGERSDEGDAAFLLRSVDRLVASGLTRGQVRGKARNQAPRRGTRELFASYGGGRSAAIVSYGLEGYIAEWASVHSVPVVEIFAAKLRWSGHEDADTLAGCDRATVVTEANKGKAREAFSHRLHLDGHEVMVVEDTPRMLARMKHPHNVGVLVVPRRDPQSHRIPDRLRQLADPALFHAIDLVLVSDSLEPLVSLRS